MLYLCSLYEHKECLEWQQGCAVPWISMSSLPQEETLGSCWGSGAHLAFCSLGSASLEKCQLYNLRGTGQSRAQVPDCWDVMW